MASTCKSCKAPMRWAKTPAGKNIPLDVAPVENGTLYLDKGIARDVQNAPPNVNRFMPHFATCPNAKRHRRRTRAR